MVSEYRAKMRPFGVHSVTGTWTSGPATISGYTRQYTLMDSGYQFTASRSNPSWLRYKKDGRKTQRADMGGFFLTYTREANSGIGWVSGNNGKPNNSYLYEAYEGPIQPYVYSAETGNFALSSSELAAVGQPGRYNPPWSSELESKGATAISRCAPTNPHADLLVALAELKNDGIESLVPKSTVKSLTRGNITRGVAEDHLGIQFGLIPLVSDLKKVGRALRDKTRIIQQYAADSDKSVRRTYRFPDEVTHTSRLANYQVGPYTQGGPILLQSNGTVTYTEDITESVWFSGSFKYHRAVGDSTLSRLVQDYQDLNHLLGLGVGPSTVWNLMPWSWAVDWFSNTGDIMKNLQMFMNDGLILEYGFVMKTRDRLNKWRRTGATLYLPNNYTIRWPGEPWTCYYKSVKKERRPANPFGFGITYDGLNFRQMSILAALGITHSARTLPGQNQPTTM